MDVVTGRDKLCSDIAEAFGLEHCRSLTLVMEVRDVVLVKATFLAKHKSIEKVKSILKEYELVEKKEQKNG